MRIEIKEVLVKTKLPTRLSDDFWEAVIRDGKLNSLQDIHRRLVWGSIPSKEKIEAYITYLQEVVAEL